MPFRRKYDPFQVSVESGFAEDGVWLIDARLQFRDGPPPVGSRLLGLAREAQKGKSQNTL